MPNFDADLLHIKRHRRQRCGRDVSWSTRGASFAIDNAGNVGIGSTNPDSKLTVTDSVGGDSIIRVQSTGNVARLRLDGQAVTQFELSSNGSFQLSEYKNQAQPYFVAEGGLANGSTVPIYIKNSGKVGVGTASPAQKLEVNGGVRLNTATAKPTCDSTTRGTFWFTQSGAGVKDSVEVCAKDAADAYAWRTIY